ncbi:MAG: Fic family protein [Thermoanaerobaculia bacterium]|nr:Fic family protein [Thermoanaerobaculia bacterium]
MSQKSNSSDTSSAPGWQPHKPYNDLPAPPPAESLESRVVLKRCIEARVSLAALEKATQLIPNPSMLINTLPILEAQASTEIENIVTTSDRLFEFLHAEGRADASTKEALRYRHALLEGLERLTTLPTGTRLAEEVCSRIKDREMRIRKVPGTALANTRTGDVIYTPPEGETRVRDHLAAWERLLHGSDSLDPLLRMAVAHYQFEAIHPFTDGNGRTGRILNNLILVEQGLLSLPILYTSRFIISKKEHYYDLLLGVTRDGAWEPWLLFMLDAVRTTADWTTEKIAAIRALARDAREVVKTEQPKIYSRELIDVLFEQPYCRIANLVDSGIAARQAAARYLKSLAKLGLLEERVSGREKVFRNRRLLELLSDRRQGHLRDT